MTCHFSNCFSIGWSGKRTIGDFSSEQLLHDSMRMMMMMMNYAVGDSDDDDGDDDN